MTLRARSSSKPAPHEPPLEAGVAAPMVRARVARRVRSPERDAPAPIRPVDVVMPARAVALELIAGRGHYERVIGAVTKAHTSVWIATANVKELMVEDGRARPGRRRAMNRSSYVSILTLFDELATRGVELRLLHAEIPSRPFREQLANYPKLVGGLLALRRCPRVHMKAVIVDGELLYLGSANWTGAGLGAKGTGRRNFELGIVTDDSALLDQVQGLYDHVWSGAECAGCKLRAECPGPLADIERAPPRPSQPSRSLPVRSQLGRRGRPRLL
ncbi:MAG: Phospholipase protein [Deltaproteobacteria bacterium]|nr:Phospholipase protein [Deltaproteobacteria bacterium]